MNEVEHFKVAIYYFLLGGGVFWEVFSFGLIFSLLIWGHYFYIDEIIGLWLWYYLQVLFGSGYLFSVCYLFICFCYSEMFFFQKGFMCMIVCINTFYFKGLEFCHTHLERLSLLGDFKYTIPLSFGTFMSCILHKFLLNLKFIFALSVR